MRNLRNCLAAILLFGPVIMAQKAKEGGWLDLMPAGEGRDLISESCTSCHNLKVIVHARMNRADWGRTINDMIQRGAPVFPEEIEQMATYLATAFGPNVPKLVNVNTATKEEFGKLPNLTPEMVNRILDARGKAGPFKNSEDLRRALGIDKAEFDKSASWLKYGE